ncbi:MAG: M1 family metallopeptidase [Nitrospiria bacterium]
MSNSNSGRLPHGVSPTSYAIELRVCPEEKTFSGTVLIDLKVEAPAASITLHALDLEIADASINAQSCRVALNPEAETITVQSLAPIPAGASLLSLSFSGVLNRQMRGLYETVAQGETYAFTQFQSTDARRMFPCFDEPALKACFRLIVTVPAALQALSNMPVVEERIKGALKRIVFRETPVMSTYLLALAVARLEKTESQVGEIEVAVWTLPGETALGRFALKVTAAVLPLLNTYFDFPCPTPKLDLVSVPDFAMGAMENWGAVFFRDSCLLLDESLSSTETRRRVADVITHEIVHQWFGNLVTMDWWDDLWLNESFAMWLACKIVDQWRPEWRFWEAFQQGKSVPLELDALENSRAIHSEVRTAAEIEEIFDVLTYEKGGACLRMIEQFLGEDTFRDGIRVYMKRHQYQNASASDLWAILEEISGQPVSEIAKDWFSRPGFPMITLSCAEGNPGRLVLTQERFWAEDETKDAAPPWSVPVMLRYHDDAGVQVERVLLKEKQRVIQLSAQGTVQWVYGNAGESGFYRTNYDPRLVQRLTAAASEHFSPTEKIGLLDNLWALCRRGDLPLGFFMETLRRFQGDETRVMVSDVCGYLEILSQQIVQPEDRGRFSDFVHQLLHPIWRKTGWDADPGDDDERRLMRADLLWTLGAVAQDEEILSELPRRQMRYLSRPQSLDPTLVTSLLRLCARSDGGSRFEQFLEKFEKSKTPEIRDQYLRALTEFNKPALACKVIDFARSQAVRPQDVWKPVRALLSKPEVQGATWEALKTHWPALCEKGGSIGAQRMIQGARALWSRTWHDDLQSFFKAPENHADLGERTLAQTLEFIRLGVRFKERQTAPLSDWLRENVNQSPRKAF